MFFVVKWLSQSQETGFCHALAEAANIVSANQMSSFKFPIRLTPKLEELGEWTALLVCAFEICRHLCVSLPYLLQGSALCTLWSSRSAAVNRYSLSEKKTLSLNTICYSSHQAECSCCLDLRSGSQGGAYEQNLDAQWKNQSTWADSLFFPASIAGGK